MNLTERFPLLHLPDRWDWASITMRFQSQVPADRLVSSTHAVAFVGVSDADGPYKPHLPHPGKAWLWGWADAEIFGPPSLPDDGERIEEVRLFPMREAARLAVADAVWLGELIMFAAECREHARSG